MTATEIRKVEDIDADLTRLGVLARDLLKGSSRWNIVWKHIDALLEERGEADV